MKLYVLRSGIKSVKDLPEDALKHLPISIGTYFYHAINGNIEYRNACALNSWFILTITLPFLPAMCRRSMLQFLSTCGIQTVEERKYEVYVTEEAALLELQRSAETDSIMYTLNVINDPKLDARSAKFNKIGYGHLFNSLAVNIEQIKVFHNTDIYTITSSHINESTCIKQKTELMNKCRILDHNIRYYGPPEKLDLAKFLYLIEQHEIIAATFNDGTNYEMQRYAECLRLLTKTMDLMIQRLGLDELGNPTNRRTIDDETFHKEVRSIVADF